MNQNQAQADAMHCLYCSSCRKTYRPSDAIFFGTKENGGAYKTCQSCGARKSKKLNAGPVLEVVEQPAVVEEHDQMEDLKGKIRQQFVANGYREVKDVHVEMYRSSQSVLKRNAFEL